MRTTDHRAWALAAALALGVALATGCGDDDDDKPESSKTSTGTGTGAATQKKQAPPYSQSAMEAKLEDTLGGSTTPSTPGAPSTSTPKVTSVKCPSDVEPGEGTAFDCKATGQAGLRGTIRVTLKSENLTPFSYKGKLGGSGVTTTLSGSVN